MTIRWKAVWFVLLWFVYPVLKHLSTLALALSVVKGLKYVLFSGNGDVLSYEDAVLRREQTGVSGLMIARYLCVMEIYIYALKRTCTYDVTRVINVRTLNVTNCRNRCTEKMNMNMIQFEFITCQSKDCFLTKVFVAWAKVSSCFWRFFQVYNISGLLAVI